jgi:hypothetical protein
MLERAKRASHIDPPASSYAIMRRARLTAERTLNPARMFTESLTPGPELENSLGQFLPRHFAASVADAPPNVLQNRTAFYDRSGFEHC